MKRVMKVFHAFVRDEDGATMIEYALLIALIAIVVAAALVTLGTTVKTRYSSTSDCVTTPSSTTCA
ncbi:MAG: Flp/Fap pilin component [Gemmatimonadetes bacterium]|jgi:pilus assembly protein Flp/PilA|nr:Flp/Fap pilin component [Gemmatimonadota bacterium]